MCPAKVTARTAVESAGIFKKALYAVTPSSGVPGENARSRPFAVADVNARGL
jgi:hypothetical protein